MAVAWAARHGKGGSDVWAQLIKVRLKPGKDTAELGKQLQAVEQPGSGLVRTLVMHDQKDPSQAVSPGHANFGVSLTAAPRRHN